MTAPEARAAGSGRSGGLRDPLPTWLIDSPRGRRRLGGTLLGFGLAGLGLIVVAAVLVFSSLSAVNDAATGFERQRTEIVAMLGPASDALDRAATSATNAGTSLAATNAAATRAASLTSNLADSFDRLAAATTFEILGTRPFGELESQFTAVATDSRSVSADLAATSAALATNITDSAAVAADMRALADQLDTLEASLGAEPGSAASSASSLPIGVAGVVLAGLLIWLAVPALASIWLGWRLTRARGA